MSALPDGSPVVKAIAPGGGQSPGFLWRPCAIAPALPSMRESSMRDEPCSTDAGNAGNSGSQRLDWRLMLPVFIIVSLDAVSSGAILPILPLFLRTLGASPLAGLILGQSLYGAWIGAVVAITFAGAVLARSRLPRIDPEAKPAGG